MHLKKKKKRNLGPLISISFPHSIVTEERSLEWEQILQCRLCLLFFKRLVVCPGLFCGSKFSISVAWAVCWARGFLRFVAVGCLLKKQSPCSSTDEGCARKAVRKVYPRALSPPPLFCCLRLPRGCSFWPNIHLAIDFTGTFNLLCSAQFDLSADLRAPTEDPVFILVSPPSFRLPPARYVSIASLLEPCQAYQGTYFAWRRVLLLIYFCWHKLTT